jgi:hypothetical protein
MIVSFPINTPFVDCSPSASAWRIDDAQFMIYSLALGSICSILRKNGRRPEAFEREGTRMSAKVASGDREAATVVANDPNDLKGELKRIGGSQSTVATVDGVVGAVLVDPGAEASRAELEGHYNYTANRVIFATLQTFCEAALVQN